jgi:dihydrofolate reductase
VGKIVISANVSLDGVMEDPTGEQGFRHGGWFEQHLGEDREEWAKAEYEETLRAEALLLGRRSYTYFSERWAPRSGEWADRLKALPKYVVSSTLQNPEWDNSSVLRGDAMKAVAQLKHQLEGDIVVYASCQLGHALMENTLVDEVRLIVFPIILGAGERVFADTKETTSVRLLSTKTIGAGLAFLAYEVVHHAC